MSEPVGNGPRIGNIQGNSHRLREANQPQEPEAKEVIEKVVTGKVVTRKQPWYKKAKQNLIADDAQTIGEFLLTDVIIPTTKNFLMDLLTEGASRALYGSSRQSLRRSVLGSRGGGIRTKYDQMSSGEPRRMMSREHRANHDFDEVILDSRDEAITVVEELIARVDRYGSASVSDLYDLVGVTGSFADQRWGWTDLRTADVRQSRGGFLLDLPRPEQLR